MTTKTITFFGASGGVGLAALKHSLAAGHKCIALCRDPSRLTDALTPSERENSNLTINKGNAHDLEAVSASLTKSDGNLVDPQEPASVAIDYEVMPGTLLSAYRD